MPEVPIPELQKMIERLHSCRASLVDSVPVLETFQGATIWNGIVHVFRLVEHAIADRCYAWTHGVDGNEDRRRCVAFLHDGTVYSPQSAVRAAILEEIRTRQQ
jgi:hypothetical protein